MMKKNRKVVKLYITRFIGEYNETSLVDGYIKRIILIFFLFTTTIHIKLVE